MKSPKAKLAMLALGAAAVTACASGMGMRETADLGPPPPPGAGLAAGQCFRSHDIRNHTIVDNHTLLMDVNGRDTYRITVDGACLAGATSSDPIVTRNPPGSDIICRPIDMDLGVSKNGFESRCIVQSIVRMSPQELAALPPKLRP